jgi:hypothetical protein
LIELHHQNIRLNGHDLINTSPPQRIYRVLPHIGDDPGAEHSGFGFSFGFPSRDRCSATASLKVIPIQMPYPDLTRLIEPFGNFSPMGILWSSIGISPAYEIFAGCAETLGGLLLIFPRTAIFGALICLADMLEVFMLNMTYDVNVKLISVHLILLALLLLTPDLRRLVNVFPGSRGGAFHANSTFPHAQRQPDRTCRADLIWAPAVGYGLPLCSGSLVHRRRRKAEVTTLRHLGGEPDVNR